MTPYNLFIFILSAALLVGSSLYLRQNSTIEPVNKLNISDSSLNQNFCRSSAEEVDRGTRELLDSLNAITNKSYFRYYKINSEKECPYWAVSLLCNAENACEVCKCDESSIPQPLRMAGDMSDVRTPSAEVSQRSPHPATLDDWGTWREVGDVDDASASYVDLVQNPEGNTGYGGPMAGRVWSTIYRENCMQVNQEDEQCSEVGILKKLFSGLHMSINLHVCTNFYKDKNFSSPQRHSGIYNNPNISFYPNCDMFNNRVAPFPEFVENLYVLYQFVLRALKKAEPFFLANLQEYNTGDAVEDAELRDQLQLLYGDKLLCARTFDEAKFLDTPKGLSLVPTMNELLLNVTRIMDCVGCEKCRIWGKLETKGIIVALKINTHNSTDITLDRAEKVSLMNTARQLAFSVRNVQRLSEVCAGKKG
ncbi:endoplasmic reticulum oxidoreductin [Angomonas deanei]|nr:endoplasmic reticulum oxidoreductin [Angomonas deanei]|eukprot:EPY30115.1 endoplasmic reticulum oxidoreductin [Angomonas deanei]